MNSVKPFLQPRHVLLNKCFHVLHPAAHRLTISLQRLVGFQLLQNVSTFIIKNITVDLGLWHVGQVLWIMWIILFSFLYWSVPPLLFSHRTKFSLDIKYFHVRLCFFFCLLLHFGCRSLVIFVYFWWLMSVTCQERTALEWMKNWCCAGKVDVQNGDVGSEYLDVWHQWILSVKRNHGIFDDCKVSWSWSCKTSPNHHPSTPVLQSWCDVFVLTCYVWFCQTCTVHYGQMTALYSHRSKGHRSRSLVVSWNAPLQN